VKLHTICVKENQVKIWILLALWSSITLWSSGHPFGGSADEPQYLQYGIEITASSVDGNVDNVAIAELLNTSCFKFEPSISALCQKDFDPSQVDSQREILVSLGNYPKPWFYLTSFPAYLDQGMKGFDQSKILAGQFAFFVIAIPILLWRKSKEVLIGIMAFSVPTLSLHMFGAYNSNGMEIAASVGAVLLLLNLDETQSASNYKYKWWITFITIMFLGSTAKPMSGALLFTIVALIILVFRLQRFTTYKDLLSVIKMKTHEVLVLVCALVFFAVSYILTIPSVDVGEQVFGSTQRQSDVRIFLTHLFNADKLFLEFAGFFGWRDTYPAPFGVTLWIASLTLLLFFYFKNNIKINKLLGVVFLVTIIYVAPIVMGIALARKYDVGIQMRYLGGLYAAIFALFVFFARNVSASKWIIFYRLNLFLYLVNFCWVYVRFAVGLSPGKGNGKEALLSLLRGESWVPQYPFLAIFSGLLLVCAILVPVRITKSRTTLTQN
jgi:Predicted membrane protein (DUF2142)